MAHPSGQDALESSLCLGELALEGDLAPDLTVKARASFDWFEQGAVRDTGPAATGVGSFVDRGNERLPTGELPRRLAPQRPAPPRPRLDLPASPRDGAHLLGRGPADRDPVPAQLLHLPTPGCSPSCGRPAGSPSTAGSPTSATPSSATSSRPKLAVVLAARHGRHRQGHLVAWLPAPDLRGGPARRSRRIRGQPQLKPEKVTSTELTYEHRFGRPGLAGRQRLLEPVPGPDPLRRHPRPGPGAASRPGQPSATSARSPRTPAR